ncbi:MAG TPA: HdeD family acid-resistance protein [Myxococcaceae bacterium]|nr:HdeD family acid-resistance protein [Myxococcaceae bacterium]
MGVLTAVIGVVMLVYPFATATSTTMFLGAMLAIAGVAEIVLALNSQSAGAFFPRLLLGALYGFTGIMLIAHPFSGAEGLTLFVGSILVIRGVLAMIAAFRVRPVDGWGGLLADGIVSLAVGILILVKWPSSTTWTIGTLLGASVLVTGIARTVFAARLRKSAGGIKQAVQGTT